MRARWRALATALTLTAVPLTSTGAAANGTTSAGYAVNAWGSSGNGLLGDNDAKYGPDERSPIQVALPGAVRIIQISASPDDTLALTSAGTIYAWGANSFGQLGDGTTNPTRTPTAVSLPTGVDVTGVAAGEYHSLAVTSTGAVYGWGDNSAGDLALGASVQRELAPALIASAPQATAVAANNSGSFVLTLSGSVYAFGYNVQGALGLGSTSTTYDTPTELSFPNDALITAISATSGVGYAIGSDGQVYGWGSNALVGEASSDLPSDVGLPAATGYIAVSAGQDHSVALSSDGTVYTWGNNTYGQLGDGSTASSAEAVQVALPQGVRIANIASGEETGYAVSTGGTVYAWGDGANGRLGDGSSAEQTTPVAIAMPQGASTTSVWSTSDTAYALVTPEPPAPIPVAINGLPRVGNLLACAVATPIPIGSQPSWTWTSNRQRVASTQTLTVPSSAHGRSLTCAVTLDDGYGTASTTSTSVSPLWQTSVSVETTPKLSGSHRVGGTERVSHGRWTPRPSAWHYQWYAGKSRIAHATNDTLALSEKLRGRAISCLVTVTRHHDNPGAAMTRSVKVTGS